MNRSIEEERRRGSTVWALRTGSPSAAVLLWGQLLSVCTAPWELPVFCQYYWTCQLLQHTHTQYPFLIYLETYTRMHSNLHKQQAEATARHFSTCARVYAHTSTHSRQFWCHDHSFQRKADCWATNTKVQWPHIDCSRGSIPGYFDISLPEKEPKSVNAGVS